MELNLLSYTLILNLPAQRLGMLAVLIALTVLAYLYMKRLRKDRTLKLGNFETLKQVSGRSSISSPSVLLIKVVTVTLLFLVATGSVQILHEQKVSNTDFVLAIDNSFSMETPDYEPTRMEMAKQRATEWIEALPENSRVGVISFSGEARPVDTLSGERSEAIRSLEQINPDLDSSGTATGEAISMASEMLSNSEEKKKIVLITDGVSTTGINLSEAAREAEGENITIDVIGISSNERTEQLYESLQEQLNLNGSNAAIPHINSDKLSNTAEMTGGEFYSIENAERLRESFESTSLKEQRIEIDSNYYISLFIALIIITELLLYSRYGAI